MTIRVGRALGVAVLAGLTVLPTLVSRMAAPANHGAHDLTTGFGRGRLDLQGIVSEGPGGSVDLPKEPVILTVQVSGAGLIHLSGDAADGIIAGSETPASVRLELPQGGRVAIESASRIRLHHLVLERVSGSLRETGLLFLMGLLAVFAATRGSREALGAVILLLGMFPVVTRGTLSWTFTRIILAQVTPAVVVALLITPLILAIKAARFSALRRVSRLAVMAFASSLALAGAQLISFEQPLPIGDPAAYLEMGGKFADAMTRVGSPLGLGPILADVQPYLALPATGLLYGVLLLPGAGLGVIYLAQAIAMALSVAALVSICEAEAGPRAAKLALLVSLIHPSFSVLPGIVQPEPFILAAWTIAALVALRALHDGADFRGLLLAGVLLGLGLGLHPQGLSFLLLALVLCLLPWIGDLVKRPRLIVAPILGAFSVLLPVAAAEQFSKPLAYVLDKEYGFFAYTSPHPLGFWLYVDSDGWQGPLRIEDTTYQKELIASKGETAVTSTFSDVALFVSRHFGASVQTLLTNLHRLWHQPDNPFAIPFVLPYGLQIPFHRALVVLFLMSLPALLGNRLAIVALPFVMLSMTYPAYHIFNKYATPALPFTIIGASLAADRLWPERSQLRLLLAGLACAALGALLPVSWFARLGVSGDVFLGLSRGLVWMGLSVALLKAIQAWGSDARSRILAGAAGFTVLMGSSFAASRTDTNRGMWSVALDQPFEVSCGSTGVPASSTADPAWIMVDVQARDGTAPQVEVNGHPLEPPAPTMPVFGLASLRGRRNPATFRQIWRTPVSEDVLASGELKIRVTGDPQTRIFGDIREGNEGPRLSLGNWPYLSVYRLMHEGQYRLPTSTVPPQACVAAGLSGRPGISLVRIPAGEESVIALKAAKPLTWIF